MALARVGSVDLPSHASGGFDHADVHLTSGRIFVAHTALGTVDVIDGDALVHTATIPGCPEASGMLCAQDEGLVFAAARGAGKVLVIDATSLAVVSEIATGPRPNGLAWNARTRTLLVADVEDCRARLHHIDGGELASEVQLAGRPRWCIYDAARDRFLVNLREPACVAVLAGDAPQVVDQWPISAAGPHGLDLDAERGLAFVACDGGAVSAVDLSTGREIASVPIAGQPDAIWHNRLARLLYVAIGRPGVVDVIDTDAMSRREQVTTEEGAHTTAFDPVRQRLAVFLPASCRAAIYQEGSR